MFYVWGSLIIFTLVGGFSNWAFLFKSYKTKPVEIKIKSDEMTSEEKAFWDQFKGTKYEKA